ncbi:hypothetical protein BJX61DRAFT_517786 [Aspergillus egyptiacus]|nr:hypothetical protein BJX61DRAFT_517786 [Aspergillus egyptiacus]
MGIDTSPLDVEESTEPPICAYSRDNSQDHNPPGDVKSTHDIKKTGCSQQVPPQDSTHAPKTRHSEHDIHSPAHHAHTIDPTSLSAVLDVDLQHGLSSAEVASRLARDGPNTIREMEGLSVWKIFLRS